MKLTRSSPVCPTTLIGITLRRRNGWLQSVWRYAQLLTFVFYIRDFNVCEIHFSFTHLIMVLQEWIQQNHILSIVLRDSLHQPQYVEKLEKILRFVIKEKALTMQDLDNIWAAQVLCNWSFKKNKKLKPKSPYSWFYQLLLFSYGGKNQS